jgi:TonB family protein
MPEPADERPASASGTPSTRRLVVRVRLIPKGSPQPPVRRRVSRRTLLLILGAVAPVLGWVGISMFRTEPTPAPAAIAPAATETTPSAQAQPPAPAPVSSEAAPAVSEQPRPKPAAASPSPINEVIPDVPRSARQTIRGTIRVSTRVIVDKDGTVLAATADEPGPSRYFERLAVEAAKKWTFPPADTVEQRIMLVRFYFKRTGTTARASSPQ